MTALELLKFARELLSDPDRHVPCVIAKTAEGKPCYPHTKEAAKWGVLGALCVKDVPDAIYRQARDALYREFNDEGLMQYEISHSHEDVIAGFDRAIAAMEAARN